MCVHTNSHVHVCKGTLTGREKAKPGGAEIRWLRQLKRKGRTPRVPWEKWRRAGGARKHSRGPGEGELSAEAQGRVSCQQRPRGE